MYKITTPSHLQASPSRAFSFSQQPAQSFSSINIELISAFIDSVSAISILHDQYPQLSNVLLINSADVNAVEEALQTDNTLTVQLKERMGKYLKTITNLEQEVWYPNDNIRQSQLKNYKSNGIKQDKDHINISQSSTPNLSNLPFQSHQNPQNLFEPNQLMQKQTKTQQLSTSRYSTVHKPIQNVSIEIRKYKHQDSNSSYSNLNTNPNQSKSRSNTKSVSNSQASQSKCFHKIQLKSVKKVGKGEKKQKDDKDDANAKNENKEKKNMKYQNQKEKDKKEYEELRNYKGDAKQERRYTISQREQKGQKSLSYQVNNMKSNSRLRASRIKDQQQPNERSLSIKNGKNNTNSRIRPKDLSPNRHIQCNPNQLSCTNGSGNSKLMSSRLNNQIRETPLLFQLPVGIGNTNLVHETVQKSGDFLQMLRMISQE